MYLETFFKVAGFRPVFRDWIAAMYSDICWVIKVNIYLSESLSIVRSVCQEYLPSPLPYVLASKLLLRTQQVSSSIPRELECVSVW